MFLPLPQGNHVAKYGTDPIYRTKVIVRKPVWMPARHTQSHNTARLETGVQKLLTGAKQQSLSHPEKNMKGMCIIHRCVQNSHEQ